MRISSEYWIIYFKYYINLEFISKSLKKVIIIYKELRISLDSDIPNIEEFLYSQERISINDLYSLIKKSRIEIDTKIDKLGFPGADTSIINDINPLFNRNEGFYDIIKSILDSLEEVKNIKVLFIIDEFENFSNPQQKFFNTLLRHPKHVKNIAIRISGRLYAIKTNETLDDKEKLLQDSEVRTVFLENIMEKNFKEFATSLYKSRILNTLNMDFNDIDFNQNFEKSREGNMANLERITAKIISLPDIEKKYFLKFYKNISNYYKDKYNIEEIMNNLSFPRDSLIEKVNTFLCYQNWSKNLDEFSSQLKSNMENNDFSLQQKALEKFQLDMLYQLFREYRLTYYYAGFEEIIKVSKNNPRIFLSILNNLFLECTLGTRLNMYKDKIPCKVQTNALIESSLWFWNNFTEDVKDHRAIWAVKELCEFFRKARQSLKPSEKTLISFAYNANDVDAEVNELVDMAVEHSLLIETSQERKSNTGSELNRQLRIHPMLSIKWELPISIGGTPIFDKDEVESLFLKKESLWSEYSSDRIRRLNPPFEKKKKDKNCEENSRK